MKSLKLALFFLLFGMLLVAGCSGQDEVESKQDEKSAEDNESIDPAFEGFEENDQIIGQTLLEFELPEAGRVPAEEVEDRFGMAAAGDRIVAYENGYLVNEETKRVIAIQYDGDEQPEPEGTQVLALFQSIVQVLSDSYTDENNREPSDAGIIISELEEVRPFLNEYPEITAWIEETQGHFQEAYDLWEEHAEQAEPAYIKGAENLLDMKKVMDAAAEQS
ncbi:hypothetical protein EQV77_14045 [Halobacillus fulvus]|nr:hypothetical protein EQV77_14045 [Halobacillus fulvus]